MYNLSDEQNADEITQKIQNLAKHNTNLVHVVSGWQE